MKRPRISIAKLMVLVAIAGANFAYMRWFGTEGTLLGTRLIVLFLWVGLLCALLTRAAARWFWGGFVVFGTFGLIGWVSATVWFPEPADKYFRDAMNAVLQRFPLGTHNQIAFPDPSQAVLAEVILTIPQLLIAWVGGMLSAVGSRRRILRGTWGRVRGTWGRVRGTWGREHRAMVRFGRVADQVWRSFHHIDSSY
jgi:hypothetical protein